MTVDRRITVRLVDYVRGQPMRMSEVFGPYEKVRLSHDTLSVDGTHPFRVLFGKQDGRWHVIDPENPGVLRDTYSDIFIGAADDPNPTPQRTMD